MTIKSSVEVHGNKRYIRLNCLECHALVTIFHHVNDQNKQMVTCYECGAIISVEWEESDETLR
jgi:ribosomal protein S27E